MKRHFVDGDIVMSHLTALLSAIFPPGEEGFIRSVRRFADHVSDPVLKKRVAGFIGQESVHGKEHRRLNEQLVAMGYPLVRVFMFDHDSRRHKWIVPRREPAAGLFAFGGDGGCRALHRDAGSARADRRHTSYPRRSRG
ncbi:metal-dependent hydrolase, partial [Mycolicibacterium vaccae]|nr:metal-dependent hydrolase [Mycolicibacterium vaccae]